MTSEPISLPSATSSHESDHLAVLVDAERLPSHQEAPPRAESPLLVDLTPQDHDQSGVLEDDDDLTIIGLESSDRYGDQNAAALDWIEQNGPEMEERRRNVLLQELQRVQRSSFVHFALLCLIPTSLLFVVVATVLGNKEECSSEATNCVEETRTFINAFTTRCICDAINVGDGQD